MTGEMWQFEQRWFMTKFRGQNLYLCWLDCCSTGGLELWRACWQHCIWHHYTSYGAHWSCSIRCARWKLPLISPMSRDIERKGVDPITISKHQVKKQAQHPQHGTRHSA